MLSIRSEPEKGAGPRAGPPEDIYYLVPAFGGYDLATGWGSFNALQLAWWSTSYANLILGYLTIGQVNEAEKTLAEARKRELAGPYLSEAAYALAFLNNDNREMQRILAEALARPDGKADMLALQSNTEAYYGHVEKSRELTRAAAHLAKHDGDKEAAADYLAEAALEEAEAGAGPRARSYATEALVLAPGQDVRTLTALALARAGDVTRAQAMAEQLDKEFPLNTLLHSYRLPAIRLALDLKRGKVLNLQPPSEAVALVEMGAPPPLHAGTCPQSFFEARHTWRVGKAAWQPPNSKNFSIIQVSCGISRWEHSPMLAWLAPMLSPKTLPRAAGHTRIFLHCGKTPTRTSRS